MRRLFGKKKNNKKRVTPTARTPEGLVRAHPMYQYALNEYAQTVPAASSNDDGRSCVMSDDEIEATISNPGAVDLQTSSDGGGTASERARATAGNVASLSPRLEYVLQEPSLSSDASVLESGHYVPPLRGRGPTQEPGMPDATYDEHYGDAYVGGAIRYVYPSGYQSMRPRSGPWKLSVIICISFTWLSVFVIDHCSADVDFDQYDQYEIDDDSLAIETRWCGSRLLYLMWVLSMSITGLATAYCSIIGYIKVRDFAVANGRSQPPGISGKSDYYVQIGDSSAISDAKYQKTIYQADGTPQFWGGHIYRPTQAAVAVTSR